ncbi:unnamed protein product [Darwinula stevensoni]|uniref:Protein NATD1 n=1 Tax=Darwinula stevensoni TaxID=69355 RepID=A0A7R8X972_9CRUS|nr:unnamed protein product [Darwinula stevensoni]CAG0884195.1 unnamed protein product [Darwinula stevensoni]
MALMSFSPAHQVVHDNGRQQFVVILSDRDRAFINYNILPSGVLDLFHTEVPEAYRGQGIAKVLAKEAFDYVVANGLRMRLTCWYLQKFLRDNPTQEYLSHLE